MWALFDIRWRMNSMTTEIVYINPDSIRARIMRKKHAFLEEIVERVNQIRQIISPVKVEYIAECVKLVVRWTNLSRRR